jgi:hypothetical protein
MDMRKFAGSKFITVDDLRDGNREEEIISVAPGQFGRPVATFASGDKLSLNVTNVNTLIKAYGPNHEDWIGVVVELAIGTLKFNGEHKEGLVVYPISPPKPVAARTPLPKQPPGKDMDDDIQF